MELERDAKATGPWGGYRRRALGAAVVSAALLGAHALASRTEAGQQRDVPRYAADVGAVAIDVLVTDGKGRFVRGLKRDDFRVLELGIPQELRFFTSNPAPVTVLVLLDSSASVRSNLVSVQKAATRFIEKLAPGDRARVGFFHERVVFGPRFTDEIKEHSAMIRQMRTQRSSHLYDALVESFEQLEPVPTRKALVVFSDGEDQGSRTTMEAVLESTRRSDVSVYAIGLLGWSADEGMYTNRQLLEQIAGLTGGDAFFPKNDEETRDAFDRIRAVLHHQYRMGYVPANGAEGPGQWREIRVELPRRRDLVVRSRLGYHSGRK